MTNEQIFEKYKRLFWELEEAEDGVIFKQDFLAAMQAARQEESKWVKVSERLPERVKDKGYSQVPCLVAFPNREISILVFNHEHECWDDETGDDHYCKIEDVEYWQPLPKLPSLPTPPTNG